MRRGVEIAHAHVPCGGDGCVRIFVRQIAIQAAERRRAEAQSRHLQRAAANAAALPDF